MPKFKIGDKVVVVDAKSVYDNYSDGDAGTVVKYDGTEVTLLEIDEDDILDAKVERDDGECDWMKSKGLTKI